MNKQQRRLWTTIIDKVDHYIRHGEGAIRTYETAEGSIAEFPIGVISLDKVLEIVRHRADLRDLLDRKNAREELEWQLIKRSIKILSTTKAYHLYNTKTETIIVQTDHTRVEQINKTKRYF